MNEVRNYEISLWTVKNERIEKIMILYLLDPLSQIPVLFMALAEKTHGAQRNIYIYENIYV